MTYLDNFSLIDCKRKHVNKFSIKIVSGNYRATENLKNNLSISCPEVLRRKLQNVI